MDAEVLEEDMCRANQRIAGYTLEACTKAGDKCSDGDWAAITQSVTGGGRQTVAKTKTPVAFGHATNVFVVVPVFAVFAVGKLGNPNLSG